MIVECREYKEQKRADLRKRLHRQIQEEFGVDCLIELVPRNTLHRTTSGKLSRSGAQKEYLERIAAERSSGPAEDPYDATLRRRAV